MLVAHRLFIIKTSDQKFKRMFKKILIANRGEIACRIHTSAKKMGIATVAVCSEADVSTKHAQWCDEVVLLGPASAAESYLDIGKVIEAAKLTGAQAIHPGYGFLSENAQFAQACEDAGIAFIGPSPQAIEIMGSKSAAKACVQTAGVPLIPGYFGVDQRADHLAAEAEKIGFPLMIKAVAGGGGKGIRAVHAASEFAQALASCQREAKNAFGDEAVMLEKLILAPRHVEVQVFADQLGNVVHLFERDCSAQRRHQKVLEEAPAYGLSDNLRAQMGQTAIDVAKAVNYVGAGTVEFLLDASGQYYFMEMNTRLQVEHPVTEMVTGFDLVQWQLKVAAGEPLPADQAHIHLNGHAFEARLYAENPATGFLPSIGEIVLWEAESVLGNGDCSAFEVPQMPTHQNAQLIRLDSFVESGSVVTPYYDPMIGKLITWGPDRATALHALKESLARIRCIGLNTNLNWLHELCEFSEFEKGGYDTGLLDNFVPETVTLEESLAALAGLARWAAFASTQLDVAGSGDPLATLDGFSATTRPLRQDRWLFNGQELLTHSHVKINGQQAHVMGRLGNAAQGTDIDAWVSLYPGVQVGEDGLIRCQGMYGQDCFDLIWHGDVLHIHLADRHVQLSWFNPANTQVDSLADSHGVRAPMPGKVFAVYVQQGDQVKKGQPLVGLEAMKMEHTLTAPQDGVVATIAHQVGDQVPEGAELVTFEDE